MGGIARAGALAVACLGCAAAAPPGGSRAVLPADFQIIAHRGASAYAPENTLPAFEKALALGAVEAELDVQLSADDVLVLFHDETLARKTGQPGRVRDHPVEALRGFDIGTWFDRTHPEVEARFAGTGLVTLRELFDSLGDRLTYHLEIKGAEPEIPPLLLREIDAFGLREHVVVTSFSFDQLARTRALDRGVPLCLLIRADDASDQREAVDRARDAGFQQVAISARSLSREIVEHARARGLAIRAFGVGDRAAMERAIDLGAGGMTINWPDWLIPRRAEAARTSPAR